MRQYTTTWQDESVHLKWPPILAMLTGIPLPAWLVAVMGFTLLSLSAVGNLPQASNPPADLLHAELTLRGAEVRDLQSEIELKHLAVERLELIQQYSSQFSIPADRATEIYDIALAEGINPDLGFNLVRVESGFRRTAVSTAGAIGFTQIRPSTARWLDPAVETRDLFDTETNLHLGFRYFRYLLEEYNGDTRLALLAYNRGPGRVGDLLTLGIDPGNGYAKAVLGE